MRLAHFVAHDVLAAGTGACPRDGGHAGPVSMPGAGNDLDLADQQDGDIRTATLVITAPAGFTDRVRHEAHCCIARAAGRDERRYLWI
jgi:hypothetical protein